MLMCEASSGGGSERDKRGQHPLGHCKCSWFLTGTLLVLHLIYVYIPKSARAYLFPQSVKIPYLCSGPISVDPICSQPSGGLRELGSYRGYPVSPQTDGDLISSS